MNRENSNGELTDNGVNCNSNNSGNGSGNGSGSGTVSKTQNNAQESSLGDKIADGLLWICLIYFIGIILLIILMCGFMVVAAPLFL